MEFPARTEPDNAPPLPPGVTPINRLTPWRRADRTLSKAVSLHLEGKIESAAGVLSRAIESGARDTALYSALGQIYYEMRDYESAAAIYEQLAALETRLLELHSYETPEFLVLRVEAGSHPYLDWLQGNLRRA